jgi:hypothetical protein
VQPSAVTHEYVSFGNKKVADHDNGVWTTGMVQYLHQDILQSMTHTLPDNLIFPNISQSFPIVWADNTDSICDLPLSLTYLDNHAHKLHRTDPRHTTRSPSSPSYQCSRSYRLQQDFLWTFTLVLRTSSTCYKVRILRFL